MFLFLGATQCRVPCHMYCVHNRRLTRVFQAINPMTPDSYLVSLATLEHYLLSEEFWSNAS